MNLKGLIAKLPKGARKPSDRKLLDRKAPLALPVAPVLLLATGAGVAVWWWTQWARGDAESRQAAGGGTDPATPDEG